MPKNYTTKTASLRATQADVRTLDTKKLFIDGVNITDLIKNGQVTILDDRGTDANDELDIWGSNVSTDKDGNVIVREYPQKFEISIGEMTERQKSTLQSAVKVENNQVLGANDKHLMFFETNALTDGFNMFNAAPLGLESFPLTTFNSDLSSLTEGSMMFSSCKNLTTFNNDLSSLTNGGFMFCDCTNLTTFNHDLSSLIDGASMFSSTSLTSFNSDLSSLTNGPFMFNDCTTLTSFSSDLSSLVNGYGMFGSTKIDAPSLANIIHTIKDRTGLSTPSEDEGTICIGLGIDDTDEARQSLAETIWCKDWNDLNQEFKNKNWTVQWQFNGAPTSAAALDMDTTPSPIWVKIEEVVADENGKLPHYSYTSKDGTKYYNLYWYHSSNGDNEDYTYFASLFDAIEYYEIVSK